MLYNLPTEILIHIAKQLAPRDVVTMSMVSQYTYTVCQDNTLWRHLMIETLGYTNKLNPYKTWKNNFITAYHRNMFTHEQLHHADILLDIPNIGSLISMLKTSKFIYTYTRPNTTINYVIFHLGYNKTSADIKHDTYVSLDGIHAHLYCLSDNHGSVWNLNDDYYDALTKGFAVLQSCNIHHDRGILARTIQTGIYRLNYDTYIAFKLSQLHSLAYIR